MNVINTLSGLLTPIIAIITVYIAYQQYSLNKRQTNYANKLEKDKLKLELYNRRYKIYEMTKNIILQIKKHGSVDLYDFMNATREVEFLFDNDIIHYVREIKEKNDELREYKGILDSEPEESTPTRSEYAKKKGLINDWFTEEMQSVENRFKKYLKLKEIGY